MKTKQFLCVASAVAGLACVPAQAADAPLHLTVAPAASSASAKVAFFGLASKTAQFPAISGTVAIDRDHPDTIAIDVTIDASRLTAGDALTQARLKGPAFFDVAHTPMVRFTGGRLQRLDASHARIDGALTARGITKPLALDVRFSQPIARIDGKEAIQIEGETRIDRRQFGMTSYPFIVGRTVTITLDIHLQPGTNGPQ